MNACQVAPSENGAKHGQGRFRISNENQRSPPEGHQSPFERIRRTNAAGIEFWSNRDFAIFQNHGYMGLYGGLDMRAIHSRKGLKKSQQILDHRGSAELAANLFRATQTEEKLRREKVSGKARANQAHHEIGAKVRQTIKELGGTMPEVLPVAESIEKVKSQHQKMVREEKRGEEKKR